MSQRERHIDVIVSLLLRGDSLTATRYYTENRVSYASFKEAKRRHAVLARKSQENNGFLFPRH